MTDATAAAFAANTNTDPCGAERRRAREKAAADPLNGRYVTTAKAPEAGIRFTARVTPFGVEIERADEERTRFELRSDFEHDLRAGYIAPARTVFVVEETRDHLERELRVTYYASEDAARLLRVDDCAGGAQDLPLGDVPAEDLRAIEEEIGCPVERPGVQESRREEERRALRVPCMGREEARAALTAEAGTPRRVVFVKRTTGRVRAMRFRYREEEGRSAPSEGLLPVWDLDKRAPRLVNLDGVLR